MAQKAAKEKKIGVSGERFYGMEKEEILKSIVLDPQKNQRLKEKGYRTYKGWAYVGGITGISYGDEVVAFQVLYNKMINDGIITGKKIKEDGEYGDETGAAIKNLQRQINEKTGMGILVDGYFGIETWSGTYALLTRDMGMLESVMKKEGRKEGIKREQAEVEKEVPKTVERRPKEEKKTLEDFYKETKKITKKSSPNERFNWDDAYAKELYEMGIVDMDDYGRYQLSDSAIEYLEKYNKEEKKEWKVTETDLEDGINGEKSFKNKHAKAVEYILSEYETAAIPGEGLPGLGEGRGFEIPENLDVLYEKIREIAENEKDEEKKKKILGIIKIIESEKDKEAKEKMLATLKALEESENPEEIIAYWLKQKDLRGTLITAGSELAG